MDFKRDGSKLRLGPFPQEPPSLDGLRSLYASAAKEFQAGPLESVSLDFSGVKPSNHSAVSLALSIASLCEREGSKLRIENLTDPKLVDALAKLGIHSDGSALPKEEKEDQFRSVFLTAGEASFRIASDFRKVVAFVGETALAVAYFIAHPRKLNLRETLFYMDKSGADAIPIVILVCFLMGMILGFQGVVQLGRFGLDIFVADLVGLAIIRELGPIMVGMICIGRAGSAYAAELGAMKGSEEVDALSTMGLKPVRMLVIPKIAALLVAMPFLTLIGDLAGVAGGVIIGTSMTDLTIGSYCARTVESLVPANLLESVLKGFVFAFIIAAVGCFRGFEAGRDAKGVGSATTSSVVTGIFLLVLADFFVTISFPQIMALFGVDY
jgi:phospholipid/cholesterol/gamma-HCH transport system permease protein